MTTEKEEVVAGSPEVHFEPVIKLKQIEVKSLEQDEEEILKMRAKVYRYVMDPEDGPQWKERGVGELKLMKHQGKGTVRILMRRDKTFKICVNHHITSTMELKPHSSSEKAFVWSTPADYADEEPKPETLAIKFGNIENAQKFKEKFESCVKESEALKSKNKDSDVSDKLADELSGLKVKENDEKDEKKCEKDSENKDDSKGTDKSNCNGDATSDEKNGPSDTNESKD